MIPFFELLQLSIGTRDSLSRILSAGEWVALYDLSVKHAVAGLCFYGVQRLPKEQVKQLPHWLKLQWLAVAEMIKQRNLLLNGRAIELTERFSDGGLRSCVLKGQGVADLYRASDGGRFGVFRQSGDIDVWVDGKRDETIRFMKEHYKCGRTVIHHIDVEVFDDVPVEVHFVPSYAYSLPRNKAYKRFFNESKVECFVHSGLGFCVPSLRFNMVYLLMHIFRHVFHEGIGLRQLMDYYFVLSVFNETHRGHGSNNAYAEIIKTLKDLGLLKFAAAVMFVEREVFGLGESYMICEPDERAGELLLKDIMRAGNFGQHDPRIRDAHSGSSVRLYLSNIKRIFGMVRFYPSEVLWAPFWKVGHLIWRKIKGYC